jgi:RND family efflux transporter MFP subunit
VIFNTGVNVNLYKSSIVILLLGLTWIQGCSEKNETTKRTDALVKVSTMTVTEQPAPVENSYSATVEPIERVNLSTRISGWIDRFLFSEGQVVPRNADIIRLRNEDLKAKLSQAEAGILEAQAYFDNSQKNFKRLESLFQKKAATKKELEDMSAVFTAAEARLKNAKAAQKEIQEMLRYSVIKAPFEGVLTKKILEAGDLANPGQHIAVLENNRRVKIVAKIPESELNQLSKGMKVDVHLPSLEQQGSTGKFSGEIERILPAAGPLSRQFDIHVILENSNHIIKSGMFARVSIKKDGRPTLLVPREALFKRGQLEGLFLVNKENTVRLRWVRTGTRYTDQVEILSGLNPRDTIVVQSDHKLIDGQIVEVR